MVLRVVDGDAKTVAIPDRTKMIFGGLLGCPPATVWKDNGLSHSRIGSRSADRRKHPQPVDRRSVGGLRPGLKPNVQY